MSNPVLYRMALEQLGLVEKNAFIPMPGGQPPAPPMDPAMAQQGGAPMDPAMMQQGGAPMDPAMQQAPADPGQPFDPSMAGPEPQMEGTPPVDPAAQDPAALYDMVVQAVRQVMQESGGAAAAQPAAEEKPKDSKGKGKAIESRLDAVEGALAQLIEVSGLVPPEGGAGAEAAGMGPGAGAPSDGAGAQAMMPQGPMDPAAGQALAAVGSGQAPIGMPPKTASANRARNIATIMRRLRA